MNKGFPLVKILGLVLVIALSHSVQAAKKGYWTWDDDKGNPQYSDRPPEGVEAVFVEKNTANSAVSAPYESTARTSNGEAADPQTMEGLAPKDPAICEQATNNLSALKSARVRITEADGSQHYLTEDEKKEQRERYQKLIDFNC